MAEGESEVPKALPSEEKINEAIRASKRFLIRNPEDGDFNQYWYSEPTIKVFVTELVAIDGRTAFLSTPSLYFSCPEDLRAKCKVFDLDEKWKDDPGFVRYDFNAPLDFGDATEALKGAFDVVVIDPPFITHEVWEQYCRSARYLLGGEVDGRGVPEGKMVVGTTIAENKPLLKEHLDAIPAPFRPSIPNLVYQYELYVNFEPTAALCDANPEIPPDD